MGFHSPLIRPAIYWGGSFGGGTLDSRDSSFEIGTWNGAKTFVNNGRYSLPEQRQQNPVDIPLY